jgi:sugar phosphate isomerase/epimerase
MDFVGKCPPDSESLRNAADRGFNTVELYLTPSTLTDVSSVVDTVASSPVTVTSVHTPHVIPDNQSVFIKTDRLASELNAYLVVHSQYAHHSHVPEFEQMEFTSNYGYENNPGASPYHIRNMILEQGHELVLDTAHLYMATDSYRQAIKSLLTSYTDQIQIIHLNDSTPIEDGLAFGSGDVGLRETTRLLTEHFDGDTVLEVMPVDQRFALEKVTEWIGRSGTDE